MLAKLTRLTMVSALALVLAVGLACDTIDDGTGGNGDGDGNGGGGGGGGTGTTLTIVKTEVVVRHDSAIKAGDDLIAYGTGTPSAFVGVSYLVPSASTTATTTGTAVPDSALYNNKAFAVGGKTVFLVGGSGDKTFLVDVLDTTTGLVTMDFPETDIDLPRIPAAAVDIGHIQADGDYCVVTHDRDFESDEKHLKVIDVSGTVPALIAFDNNPAGITTGVSIAQVAVDAASKTVVAVVGGSFFIYDIDNPTAAPTEIVSPNGIGDVQIQISGNYIIAQDDQAYEKALLVSLVTNAVIDLTAPADAQGAVAIGGTKFVFFANFDVTEDKGQRASVGTVPGPGFSKAPYGNMIDGSTGNNGYVGYGSHVCVVPDGSYIFLGSKYLQYSSGDTSFSLPADPDGVDPYGCAAYSVDASSNTLAFKTQKTYASTTDKQVGFIILP